VVPWVCRCEPNSFSHTAAVSPGRRGSSARGESLGRRPRLPAAADQLPAWRPGRRQPRV